MFVLGWCWISPVTILCCTTEISSRSLESQKRRFLGYYVLHSSSKNRQGVGRRPRVEPELQNPFPFCDTKIECQIFESKKDRRARNFPGNLFKSNSLYRDVPVELMAKENICCLYPTCPEFTQALSEQKKGFIVKARESFQKSLKKCPGDVRIYVAWSKMELQEGKTEQARRLLLAAEEIDSSSAHVLCALAILEEKLGRTSRAREIFLRCIELDPKDGVAWQAYALFETRQGRDKEAREIFCKGVQYASKCAYLWQAWGVYEQKKGKLREATDKFRLATAADPTHCPSWQAWAIVEEKLGNIEFARELFEKALQVDPHSAPTYQAFGLLESRQGNKDRARRLFKRGLGVNPQHSHLLHAWAQLEESAGNFEFARQLYDWGVKSEFPKCQVTLKSWLKMEISLGYFDESMSKLLNLRSTAKQVVEELRIMRKLLESRSEADIHLFMQWLSNRAKEDQQIWARIRSLSEAEGRKIQKWMERRSSEDIKAFYEWLQRSQSSTGFLHSVFRRDDS
jgi:tetratricopeptide (TPR) repeat protein